MPATDLRQLAADVQTEITAKKTDAATKWAAFVELRDSATKEGVDFVNDADAFQKLDDAGKDYDALRDEINGLETKWARLVELSAEDQVSNPLEGPAPKGTQMGPHPLERALKTLGKSFTDSDIYQELVKSGRLANRDVPLGSTEPVKVLDRDVTLKTLITGLSDTSAGALIVADRQDTLVDLPRRPLKVASLVNSGTTDSDTVEYVQFVSRTNNAEETAEAVATWDGSGMAPESALTLLVVQTTVRDITNFIPTTKKALSDAGQTSTLINGEVANNVLERLDTQMISGDGVGEHLKGILNQAGILTRALAGDTRSDAVHKAITAIRLQFLEPTVIGLYPTDEEDIVLEKETGTGVYVYGPPSQSGPRTIWGLTPVVSPVFTNGTPLVGDFQAGATLWLREGLSVVASDSPENFFLRRMVAVMGVLRAAFGVQRPTAFCTITGF